MPCKPGEIIGIPFPFTDLSTKKRRPVLVLTNPDRRGDFMCLAVTSVLTKECAVGIDVKSMVTGYLPKPSYVRYDKIFTLNDSIIVKLYGTIGEAKLQEVNEKLCNYLGCNKIQKD